MPKKRWLQLLLLVALIGFGSWGYQTRHVNKTNMTITAVGSTALQPLVEAAGEDTPVNTLAPLSMCRVVALGPA